MLTDALLNFAPIGSNQSMVGGAGVSIVIAPGGVALDLLGAGVGVAPASIIGTASVFGTDFGVGVRKALLACAVGTAFATGNAATWNLALQFAQDTGAVGGYQPGTFHTVIETGAQPVSYATAGALIGRFDWPPQLPANFQPRFARLLMQFPAATNLSAGTIAYALVTMDRDDQANQFAAKNFAVA